MRSDIREPGDHDVVRAPLRPPHHLLVMLRLEREQPAAVYCERCRHGRPQFMFWRYGSKGMHAVSKGKNRVSWSVCEARVCEAGHVTVITATGVVCQEER